MSGPIQRTLLRNLAKQVASERTEQDTLADVVLMTVLADGLLTDDELASCIRTLSTYAEFAGSDVQRLFQRAKTLRVDAPFFSDERQDVVRDLPDPRSGRLALSLAAKITSAQRPLQSEEAAVLQAIGEDLAIPERERERLIEPWSNRSAPTPPAGYRLCSLNAPEKKNDRSVFDAMARADTEELGMMLHKFHAARSVMSRWYETAEVVAVGEFVAIGPFHYRVDAYLTFEDRRLLFRFLAPNEALHPLEREILELFTYRVEDDATLLIAAAGPLAPDDWAMIRAVGSPKLEVLMMNA